MLLMYVDRVWYQNECRNNQMARARTCSTHTIPDIRPKCQTLGSAAGRRRRRDGLLGKRKKAVVTSTLMRHEHTNFLGLMIWITLTVTIRNGVRNVKIQQKTLDKATSSQSGDHMYRTSSYMLSAFLIVAVTHNIHRKS